MPMVATPDVPSRPGPGCAGKIRYRSLKKAEDALRTARNRGLPEHHRVSYCDLHAAWHIAHKPARCTR